jgi:hypothetical protein
LSCPEGTYGNGSAATSCLPCPAGQHSTALGAIDASSCVECPAGSFSYANAATSCLSCPLGETSDPGAARCRIACDAGSYQHLTPPGECRVAPHRLLLSVNPCMSGMALRCSCHVGLRSPYRRNVPTPPSSALMHRSALALSPAHFVPLSQGQAQTLSRLLMRWRHSNGATGRGPHGAATQPSFRSAKP